MLYEYYKIKKESKTPEKDMLDELYKYVTENAEYLMYEFDFNDNENIDKLISKYEKKNTYELYGETLFKCRASNHKYIEKYSNNSIKLEKYDNEELDFYSLIKRIFLI